MALVPTNNSNIFANDQTGDFVDFNTGDPIPLEKLPKDIAVKPLPKSDSVLGKVNDFISQHGFGAGIGPGNPELAKAMPMGSAEQLKQTALASTNLLPVAGAVMAPELLPLMGIASAPLWGSATAMGVGAGLGKVGQNKITGQPTMEGVPAQAIGGTVGGFAAPMLSSLVKTGLTKIAAPLMSKLNPMVGEAVYGTSNAAARSLVGDKFPAPELLHMSNRTFQDPILEKAATPLMAKIQSMEPKTFIKMDIPAEMNKILNSAKKLGKFSDVGDQEFEALLQDVSKLKYDAMKSMAADKGDIGLKQYLPSLSSALGRILSSQGATSYIEPKIEEGFEKVKKTKAAELFTPQK